VGINRRRVRGYWPAGIRIEGRRIKGSGSQWEWGWNKEG
jgi:hypothetical protein